jgi:SAM-dependent methyltransferase
MVHDASLFGRIESRARSLLQGHLSCYNLARSLVKDKAGLEIGGPSAVFREWYRPLPIYTEIASLDNCDISQTTTWASHANTYSFSPRKAPGKNIFCDGSNLSTISNDSYDFVLSSHNLEHFANPAKALREWQRVIRAGGGLILVLPNYAKTFDHRREPTAVSHMLDDFDQDTQEDDLTHLPEILHAHDLNMDPLAGSPEEFHQRSLNNFTNRCLHHHVFDEVNSRELLTMVGLEVIAVETALPFHIFLLARVPETFA